MAESHKSKSGKKNKKRGQKRLEARLEKIKQDGIVEQILEKEDPIMALKKKLQLAKDNKDHTLAAEIREQLWIAQDRAAGYSTQQTEFEYQELALARKEKSSPLEVKSDDDTKNTVPESSSTLSPLEKKLRNLKKKLQKINNLKEKRDNGETLEELQIKKIATEEEILEEIEEIQLTLANVTL